MVALINLHCKNDWRKKQTMVKLMVGIVSQVSKINSIGNGTDNGTDNQINCFSHEKVSIFIIIWCNLLHVMLHVRREYH